MRIHILQVILQNAAMIAIFTNSQKYFKLNHDNMKKSHAKLEICNNGQNSTLCIEQKSAIVENLYFRQNMVKKVPLCSEKVHILSLAGLP